MIVNITSFAFSIVTVSDALALVSSFVVTLTITFPSFIAVKFPSLSIDALSLDKE